MADKAKDNQFVKEIADINKDFPQWYTDVVLKTELVDYGPVNEQWLSVHMDMKLGNIFNTK